MMRIDPTCAAFLAAVRRQAEARGPDALDADIAASHARALWQQAGFPVLVSRGDDWHTTARRDAGGLSLLDAAGIACCGDEPGVPLP